MKAAGEPSVEEILDSIKKVIARDNRAEADQLRRRREQEGIVVTTSPPERPSGDTPLYPEDEPAPVLELTEAELAPQAGEGEEDQVPIPHQARDEQSDVENDSPQPRDEPLTAEISRSSVRDTLTALAMLTEPGARPQIVRSGETSLEGLTRELLRPMLAEWLDKNLPGMVDRLVAAEISRIVGKRG